MKTTVILAFTSMAVGLSVIALLIVALILAFEIWMFVDAIQNDKISSDRKILWLLGMLLIHPFVAIVYYFTDRQRG